MNKEIYINIKPQVLFLATDMINRQLRWGNYNEKFDKKGKIKNQRNGFIMRFKLKTEHPVFYKSLVEVKDTERLFQQSV